MQKKFNAFKKFKIYKKLVSEKSYDVFDKEDERPDNVLEPKEDKDTPGVIKSQNPMMQELYNKLMKKYTPSELIYDNVKENLKCEK